MKKYEKPQFSIESFDIEEAMAAGIETEFSIPGKWE